MRHLFVLLLACLLATGCGGVDPGGTDPGDTSPDGGSGNDLPDGGSGGDGGPQPGDPPFPPDEACHEVSEQASLTKKPIDIIIVIDNSGSMSNEIEGVERNINENFADILEQSGVDYRVILISRHGQSSSQNICIKAPLSGTSCSPVPSQPANTERFKHLNTSIDSYNALKVTVDRYNDWKGWLRPNSFKSFIVVTDDESRRMTPEDFEAALFSFQPAGTFGTAAERNFVFHSIIGIEPKNPPNTAYGPDEPKSNTKCSTAYNPGVQYEDLSIWSGGLRFPVCETASYDAVFQAAAQDVIERSRVACSFTPPPTPPGQTYDQAYIAYTPGAGGEEQYFLEVSDAASCNDKGFTRDPENDEITLCPATCSKVEEDEAANLSVRFSCEIHID
ncbi:MAG TPA: vWA domain-containing protein [Myxococcaceae bacterium]|nr:vWA domain-containing protein [Myxococcaceae bacterium]